MGTGPLAAGDQIGVAALLAGPYTRRPPQRRGRQVLRDRCGPVISSLELGSAPTLSLVGATEGEYRGSIELPEPRRHSDPNGDPSAGPRASPACVDGSVGAGHVARRIAFRPVAGSVSARRPQLPSARIPAASRCSACGRARELERRRSSLPAASRWIAGLSAASPSLLSAAPFHLPGPSVGALSAAGIGRAGWRSPSSSSYSNPDSTV